MQSGLHTVTVLKLRNFFNYFETQKQVENVLHPKCDTFFVSKGSLTRNMNTYKENPTCGKSKKKFLSKKDFLDKACCGRLFLPPKTP